MQKGDTASNFLFGCSQINRTQENPFFSRNAIMNCFSSPTQCTCALSTQECIQSVFKCFPPFMASSILLTLILFSSAFNPIIALLNCTSLFKAFERLIHASPSFVVDYLLTAFCFYSQTWVSRNSQNLIQIVRFDERKAISFADDCHVVTPMNFIVRISSRIRWSPFVSLPSNISIGRHSLYLVLSF